MSVAYIVYVPKLALLNLPKYPNRPPLPKIRMELPILDFGIILASVISLIGISIEPNNLLIVSFSSFASNRIGIKPNVITIVARKIILNKYRCHNIVNGHSLISIVKTAMTKTIRTKMVIVTTLPLQ